MQTHTQYVSLLDPRDQDHPQETGYQGHLLVQSLMKMEKEVVYGESGGNAFDKKYQDVPVFSFTVSYRINKSRYSSVWSLQIL